MWQRSSYSFIMNPTTQMTRITLQYLLLACFNKKGLLIRPSYKKELLECATRDDIKRLIWSTCKDSVTNMESFKKGQRFVDYDALYEWTQAEKKLEVEDIKPKELID